MNRFLVTLRHTDFTDAEIKTEVHCVSEEVGPHDVTYHPKTVLFFFMETELSKEEIASLLTTVLRNNINHVFLNDEHFRNVKKYYIPEENSSHILGWMEDGNDRVFTFEDVVDYVEII